MRHHTDTGTEGPSQPLFALIQERDVDLLVVEELICSPSFRRLLLSQALPGVAWESLPVEVVHSVSRPDEPGETDIEVRLNRPGAGPASSILVLIENKVDAVFQPRQAQRYQDAAAKAMTSGHCAVAKTLLVAPEAYLRSRPETQVFDANISYEEMIKHFRARADGAEPESRARFNHRAHILEMAVAKSRRGYTPVSNQAVSAFWLRYWATAVEQAPTLALARPSDKPRESTWVRFPNALDPQSDLPRAFLSHKLEQGRVHLELPGWATKFETVRTVVDPADTDISVRRAGKSLALIIDVPAIDARQPFDDQVESVGTGLAAALRLQCWWRDNRARLAAIVGHNRGN